MHERQEDLKHLQQVLDQSAATSGAHLREAFSQADRRPSASDVVAALVGIFEMHLAALSSSGAPLVAPVDAICFRGRIWFGLPPESLRSRLVRKDPRVSASYDTGGFGFIVHGTFHEAVEGSEERAAFDDVARALYVARYGDWFDDFLDERARTRGAGTTGWIEPRRFYAKEG